VSEVSGIPFEVEPIQIGELLVHVFDGQTIDLLLTELDTAPDFLAYLAGRAGALTTSASYRFAEEDLLAESIQNWAAGSGLSPAAPVVTSVVSGRWSKHQKSGRAARSSALNTDSRTIDRIIEHFHEVFEQQRYLNGSAPGILDHELALRLLAAESRFSRRMIVTPLYDILQEHDQSVSWSSTVASPREASLRYLWLIYPDPEQGMDPDSFVRLVDAQLRHQTLVICGEFRPNKVVAIALPNGKGKENVVIMRVFDGSNWTDDDRREAERLKEMGLFGRMTATDYVHRP
jgi:glutathione S-transferase